MMQAENEKLDMERESTRRLLSEMEVAGAQKAAELDALAQENESLFKERASMEELVSTAQQQAEATSLELSHTVLENSKLRESAETMQMELHRLQAEKLDQQVIATQNAYVCVTQVYTVCDCAIDDSGGFVGRASKTGGRPQWDGATGCNLQQGEARVDVHSQRGCRDEE